MCKLDCKRGYKRYLDFNNNRLVIVVKNWFDNRLMIDFYYNENFLGYIITKVSWSELFNSDKSDELIFNLMKSNEKLGLQYCVVKEMKLSEENLVFINENLELYVNVPYHQEASVKICKSSGIEKIVLHECVFTAFVFDEVRSCCEKFLEGLEFFCEILCSLNQQ